MGVGGRERGREGSGSGREREREREGSESERVGVGGRERGREGSGSGRGGEGEGRKEGRSEESCEEQGEGMPPHMEWREVVSMIVVEISHPLFFFPPPLPLTLTLYLEPPTTCRYVTCVAVRDWSSPPTVVDVLRHALLAGDRGEKDHR